MPEEVGLHADAARAKEAALIQRFRISGEADQAFAVTLRDAYESALRGRRQLDAIGAEIESAVAHQQALALDTPAGAHEFRKFLTAKTQDIQRVVATTAADSQAKAAGLQSLSAQYAATPARDGPEFVGADKPPAAPGEDNPAPWPWDDNTVPGTPVRPFDGVLDDQAWQIARQSPTLLDQWSKLFHDGWHFESNPGQGTYTQYNGRSGRKVINIDPSLRGDPARLVNDVAHEMGHALSGVPRVDRSSRESCIQSQLDDEGAAMMNAMMVEREILARGGPDILPPKDPGSQFNRSTTSTSRRAAPRRRTRRRSPRSERGSARCTRPRSLRRRITTTMARPARHNETGYASADCCLCQPRMCALYGRDCSGQS